MNALSIVMIFSIVFLWIHFIYLIFVGYPKLFARIAWSRQKQAEDILQVAINDGVFSSPEAARMAQECLRPPNVDLKHLSALELQLAYRLSEFLHRNYPLNHFAEFKPDPSKFSKTDYVWIEWAKKQASTNLVIKAGMGSVYGLYFIMLPLTIGYSTRRLFQRSTRNDFAVEDASKFFSHFSAYMYGYYPRMMRNLK